MIDKLINLRLWLVVVAVLGIVILALGQQQGKERPLMVEVKRKPSDPKWEPRETVVLDDLTDYVRREKVELSRYGGLRSAMTEKTGFFYAKKIDGRWWLVDPDGCLFLSIGVCSVRPNPTQRGQAAMLQKFGSHEQWVQKTTELLWDLGFNTLGCWSSWQDLRKATPPMPYTTQSNFMSSYGKLRGGTFQQPGHTGYPNDCIFAFDPQFEEFCERHAKEMLSATRDDPYLLGHFSDNEMPLRADALDRYLQLQPSDPGYQAAQKWCEEHKVTKGANGYSDQDRQAFLEYLVATYYRIVSQAIKKADPNHLYLGSRFYGGDLSRAAVFRGCSQFADVISVNYYGAWTPNADRMNSWLEWSGKPFVITEWYAKGMDSGMPNNTGAGWTVKTQADRGRFYQNFTLALLANPGCVGWHWFKYGDNDPTDTKADPSNQDSNKGIVSNVYETYVPLAEAMKELNQQAYPLREFLLAQKTSGETLR